LDAVDASSTISLNNISSETNDCKATKLYRNDSWVVPCKSCSDGSDLMHKYVTGPEKELKNAILKNLLV
jgi:hypothetical protein